MEQNANTKETEYLKETDHLESMLQAAYPKDNVPKDVNIRLQNQIKCKEVMGENKVSFWWLPATLSTILSLAISLIVIVLYCILEIKGADSWMPNLVSHISTFWLKLNLIVLVSEVALSWFITIVGLWKGNFRKSAKILN